MATNPKSLSIICFSGEFDKAVAAFTLATGAAAVNFDVNLFFTFWGLNIIKQKPGRCFTGRGILAGIFGFLMGGRNRLPMSRHNFAGISPGLMTAMTKKQNIATLTELIESAIALGVGFYACDMSVRILGLDKDDFIPQVKETIGVAKFLELSGMGATLFI